MATLTATRIAYKATGATTDAQCVRIVRQDGTTLRLTSATEALTMSTYIDTSGVSQALGADVTYTPTPYKATATASGQNFEPGTVDLEGVLASAGIQRSDMLKGLYDQARIYIFLTDYKTPVEDEEKIMSGFFGETEIRDGVYTTTFKSLSDALSTRTGFSYSPTCTARLGDTRCGVQLTAVDWVTATAYTTLTTRDAKLGSIVTPTTQTGFFYKCTVAGTSDSIEPTWPTVIGNTVADNGITWTAIAPYVQSDNVDTSADNRNFVDASRTEADGWWKNGKILFTSGNNSGMTVDVKDFVNSTNTVTLKQELPFTLTAGDTYTITVGCQKRFTEDCQGKFDNVYNNRSHPWMPGRNVLGKFGGQ